MRTGVTFTSKRIDDASEFLTSTDNWFRPVNFIHAPAAAQAVAGKVAQLRILLLNALMSTGAALQAELVQAGQRCAYFHLDECESPFENQKRMTAHTRLSS